MEHPATAPAFTPEQEILLDLCLDALIPACPERGLPSGSKVAFAEFAARKGLVPAFTATLDAVERLACDRWGAGLAALEPRLRLQLLTDRTGPAATAVSELGMYLLQCFYTNPLVIAAIGLEPRAPFPDGYEVPEGDLLLLEIVFLRGKLYRDV